MELVTDKFEIYKHKILNWKEKKDRLIKSFYKSNPRMYGNVLTNFNMPGQYRNMLIEVNELFKNEINEFLELLNLDLFVESAWIQEYGKNMSHGLHDHGDGYSSVIFINFDKNEHSSTIFFDEEKNFSYSPEVEEGDMIFFNSKHLHQCPYNKSDSKRMVCSFNLKDAKTYMISRKKLIYF